MKSFEEIFLKKSGSPWELGPTHSESWKVWFIYSVFRKVQIYWIKKNVLREVVNELFTVKLLYCTCKS